jgi:hypothetical protein
MGENVEIGTWLLQQAPVIVVMGIVIYWLAKRLEKAQEEKDVLSRDVVKLTTLWQEQSDNGKDEEILRLLSEIKSIVERR